MLAYRRPAISRASRKRHYGDHPDYAGEATRICCRSSKYDGWAARTMRSRIFSACCGTGSTSISREQGYNTLIGIVSLIILVLLAIYVAEKV